MVHHPQPRLIDRLPLIGGGVAGLALAAAAALLPAAVLEAGVRSSGIAGLVPVAAPPLGATARATLALAGGLGTAAVVWAILFLLVGPGGLLRRSPRDHAGPAVRRADAHPDAPPRRPISAADLGPPPPPAVQDLPRDLDQPLATFDPAAVPDVPRAPTPALPSLAPPPALAEGERIETFDLSPRQPGSTEPSIEQLLRRLEQGTARRCQRAG
jgi:hypothetical protein